MPFDDLLCTQVGEFGRFQKWMTFVIQLVVLPGAFNMIEMIFTGATPEFWPVGTNRTDNISDQCTCTIQGNGSLVTGPCTAWQYDTSIYESTIVTQYNLVCDRQWLVAVSRTIYMCGYMAIFLAGIVADKYGRRPVLMAAVVLNILSRIAAAFSPTVIVYAICRAFVGMAEITRYTAAFILLCEMVGPKQRLLVGILPLFSWSTGCALAVGVAYLIRDRFILELSSTAFFLPLLGIYWIIPESPRWLYSQGRYAEANIIMAKMAKCNGKTFTEDAVENMLVGKLDVKELDVNVIEENRIVAIIKSRVTLLRSLIIAINWCSISFVYYGLILNSGNLAGDTYLNTFLSVVVETVGYMAILLALSSALGRCLSLAMALILSGVFLLATAPLSQGAATLTLGLLGKGTISFAFGAIYIFTSEIYPTPIRSLGVGIGSFSARIGGMTAPFVVSAARSNTMVAAISFGVFSLTSGALLLFLPETKGRKLPQTLQDSEQMDSFMISRCRRSIDGNKKSTMVDTQETTA